MPASHTAAYAALLAAVTLTVAGCGGNTQPVSPSPGSTQNTSSSPARQGEQMKIQITIGDQRMQATIFDSAAGRDLIAQLPLTIEMTDHGSVEKTGPLPSPLSLDGQPDGADPNPADVGYYAPGNDLVFYYGDQSYYPGIVIIGHLDGDAASRIAAMNGAITATVQAHTR
jgi:hypothetical protein